MISTIDKLGRIVIPKAVRDEAGWQAGTPLGLRYRYGVLEISAIPSAVEDSKFEKRGTVWVSVAAVETTPLEAATVEALIEGVRESAVRELAGGER